jgi:hypothetical protein
MWMKHVGLAVWGVYEVVPDLCMWLVWLWVCRWRVRCWTFVVGARCVAKCWGPMGARAKGRRWPRPAPSASCLATSGRGMQGPTTAALPTPATRPAASALLPPRRTSTGAAASVKATVGPTRAATTPADKPAPWPARPAGVWAAARGSGDTAATACVPPTTSTSATATALCHTALPSAPSPSPPRMRPTCAAMSTRGAWPAAACVPTGVRPGITTMDSPSRSATSAPTAIR